MNDHLRFWCPCAHILPLFAAVWNVCVSIHFTASAVSCVYTWPWQWWHRRFTGTAVHLLWEEWGAALHGVGHHCPSPWAPLTATCSLNPFLVLSLTYTVDTQSCILLPWVTWDTLWVMWYMPTVWIKSTSLELITAHCASWSITLAVLHAGWLLGPKVLTSGLLWPQGSLVYVPHWECYN